MFIKGSTIMFSFVAATLSLATTLPPFYGECKLLERFVSIAVGSPQWSGTALGVLERIALGHADEVSAEAEREARLEPNQLKGKAFMAPEVRACAFQKIGETALPQAVEFLTHLTPADVGVDISQQVWPASRLALAEATLRTIQDPQQQIEFLEKTAAARSGASFWAVDQLCDRGSLGSLVPIQEKFRTAYSGQRAEDEIAFCDARIRTLYGKPDRAKALGAVLNLQTSADNPRLTGWAIEQLFLIRSPAAQGELTRFLQEIDTLPAESPSKSRVLQFRPMITLAPPGTGR